MQMEMINYQHRLTTVESLGAFCMQVRKSRGIRLKTLASKIGCKSDTISFFERGRSSLSLPFLVELLKVLQIEVIPECEANRDREPEDAE